MGLDPVGRVKSQNFGTGQTLISINREVPKCGICGYPMCNLSWNVGTGLHRPLSQILVTLGLGSDPKAQGHRNCFTLLPICGITGLVLQHGHH